MTFTSVFSFIPKFLTEKTVSLIQNWGWTVTDRWVSLLFFFIAGILILLGIRITKPFLKYLLIVVGAYLLASLLIPNW